MEFDSPCPAPPTCSMELHGSWRGRDRPRRPRPPKRWRRITSACLRERAGTPHGACTPRLILPQPASAGSLLRTIRLLPRQEGHPRLEKPFPTGGPNSLSRAHMNRVAPSGRMARQERWRGAVSKKAFFHPPFDGSTDSNGGAGSRRLRRRSGLEPGPRTHGGLRVKWADASDYR